MSLFKKKEAGKHLSEAEKERRFYKKLAATLATTTKQLIWLYAMLGAIWISCSYVLAFMGKEQIAESLSSTVGEVVVGTLIGYLVTSTVEKVFTYNEFSFSKHKKVGGNKNAHDEQSGTDAGVVDPATIGPDE